MTRPRSESSSQWTFEDSPVGSVLVAPAPEGTALFYTTRDFDGHLSAGKAEIIQTFVASRFSLEGHLTTCHQIHGTAAAKASSKTGRWCEESGCDALWTSERGVILGIKVADCLPVSLVDSRASVTANIHAGWRGSAAGILDSTLAELPPEFAPTRASAFLGPSIRACCFEVGEEVVEQFAWHDSFDEFVDRSHAKPHIDLTGFATAVLRSAGFRPDAIHDSGICTRCDERFHSYRRGRENAGRNLALVAQ